MEGRVRRREFITLLGGAATVWPLTVRAQQGGRIRRIGILMPFPPSDTEIQSRVSALRQELQRLGWTRGINIEFDERWTTDNMDMVRTNAANLVELKSDVIVAHRVIPILMQLTRTIPIIIPGAVDAVGEGFIKSLARPGGNVTGFAVLEFSILSKILDTLKVLAPATSRIAMIYNPDNPSTAQFRRLFESFALPLSVQPIIAPVHSIADIERAMESLATEPNGGVFSPRTLRLSRFATKCPTLSRASACRQSIQTVSSWSAAASPPTTRIVPTYFAALRPTSTVFCAGKNPAICLFSSRQNTSSLSTSKPRGRLVSPSRHRFSTPPTR
jgi:hypothetical protein